MKVSINPHQAVQIESFEEYRTLNSSVELFNGEEHPLTQHLREVGRRHFNFRSGKFTPETIHNTDTVDFASVALNSLYKMSRSDDPNFALSARFILKESEVFVGPLVDAPTPEPVPVLHDPPVRAA